MKKYHLFAFIFMSFTTLTSFADVKGFISIPAAAFSTQDSRTSGPEGNYRGNNTGTSRSFRGGRSPSFRGSLFAPVNLPHGAIVTSLSCGSKTMSGWKTGFVLRRNEPQQENIDMASVKTSGHGRYEFINTISISSPKINNSKYNYYISASLWDGPFDVIRGVVIPCLDYCANVNFCNIGYTIVERDPDEGAGKVKVDDRRPGSIEIIR
jgi:hypothetical protein